MTPQTVNAYYSPALNEIVFPAAILQPPFVNLEADETVNYGANGAVRNVPEFYEAFDVAEGNALYLPPEERVKIW